MVKSKVVHMIVCLFFLYGCSATPQTLEIEQYYLDRAHSVRHLSNVPFYPQTKFYCGPTTLRQVFEYHGKNIDIDQIASNVFIPEKEGSLQVEMVSTARKFGFLAYSKQGSLKELIELINDDIPVIVFQNNGLSWAPAWHYAVVIGYDLASMEVIMHSGVTENHRLPFAVFERTWQRADFWMMAPLTPGLIKPSVEPYHYINAAYDLLTTGQEKVAISNLETVVETWPDEWLSYFLIADHYSKTDKPKALAWYAKGYEYGKSTPAYVNNFAYLLWEVGCQEQSEKTLKQAQIRMPNSQILTKTVASTTQMQALTVNHCPSAHIKERVY